MEFDELKSLSEQAKQPLTSRGNSGGTPVVAIVNTQVAVS